MEEAKEVENLQSEEVAEKTSETARTDVGFPQSRLSKKGSTIEKIIVLVVVLAVIGGGIMFFSRKQNDLNKAKSQLTPTPTSSYRQRQLPTSTPTPLEINRSAVRIQVLNGSGITGDAAKVKRELEKLGYSNIETGNASEQNFVSSKINYSESLDSKILEEIKDKLEEFYQSVETNRTNIRNYDLQIITGYPKSFSPTPSPKPISPTSKPTQTSTPTPS